MGKRIFISLGEAVLTELTQTYNCNKKKAYKLFTLLKNGEIRSLFINKRKPVEFGKWLIAEPHKTKGYAYRPGWHCLTKPEAPHLSKTGRVWAEVEIYDVSEFSRPKSQGDKWYLAKYMKVNKLL